MMKRAFQSEEGTNAFNEEKFLGDVSDSTLQLNIKKSSLVEFLCNIKEYSQLLEKTNKILLFQLPSPSRTSDFFGYFSQNN